MFTKKVTDDDHFMSLSSSAQALYLHLSMSADDDGFSNQVSLSMFKAHASIQDLEAPTPAKGFLLLNKNDYISVAGDGVKNRNPKAAANRVINNAYWRKRTWNGKNLKNSDFQQNRLTLL